MFKKQTGITLVALVVTIIVLLILAGVSISLVVGNNGVLTQASNSVVKTKAAEAKQAVDLALGTAETIYHAEHVVDSSVTRDSEYKEAFVTELANQGYTVDAETDVVADALVEVALVKGAETITVAVCVDNATGAVQFGKVKLGDEEVFDYTVDTADTADTSADTTEDTAE